MIADIVAFGSPPDRRRLADSDFARLRIVLATDDWASCESALASHQNSCLAYFDRALSSETAISRISQVRGRHADCPVVVVTDPDLAAVRQLCSLGVDEIVWSDEPPRQLMAAFVRASARRQLRSHATTVTDAPGLAPVLREALLRVLSANEVVGSVKELAALMRCSRATLWYHWARATQRHTGMRLEDVLDWMILHRAVALKAGGLTWGAAASRLHVSEASLSRIMRRLTGERPRDFTSESATRMANLFAQQFAATMPRAADAARGVGVYEGDEQESSRAG